MSEASESLVFGNCFGQQTGRQCLYTRARAACGQRALHPFPPAAEFWETCSGADPARLCAAATEIWGPNSPLPRAANTQGGPQLIHTAT